MKVYFTKDRYGYCLHFKTPKYSKELDIYIRHTCSDVTRKFVVEVVGELPKLTHGRNFLIEAEFKVSAPSIAILHKTDLKRTKDEEVDYWTRNSS